MVVRGVLRSWETARSKLARIRSFSLSAFIASCCLSLVVRALVRTAIAIMIMPEIKFTGIVKLSAKYGKVNA